MRIIQQTTTGRGTIVRIDSFVYGLFGRLVGGVGLVGCHREGSPGVSGK